MMYCLEYYHNLKLISIPVFSFEHLFDVLKMNSFEFVSVKRIFKVFDKEAFKLELKYRGVSCFADLRCVYDK